MIKVSIVIPTFNRCDSVKRALAALADQTFPHEDFEVIVSIDGSEDGTKEMVDTYKTDFRLRSIWNTNSGRASACNKAILDAVGEVLIILDDDMEPCPGLIEAHYTAHQGSMKLGVIGAAPIIIDASSAPLVRHIGTKFNSHIDEISEPGYSIKIWDFYSGNFSIRREVILEINLYNEIFRIYGNEDVELARRLLRAGVNLVFNPKALSIQHYEKNFTGFARDTISEGRTAILLVSQFPDTFNELKLREYNHAGWKWRYLRYALIQLSLRVPGTTDLIIYIVGLLEKYKSKYPESLYALTIDYFFWLGAWSEIRAGKDSELLHRIKSCKWLPR